MPLFEPVGTVLPTDWVQEIAQWTRVYRKAAAALNANPHATVAGIAYGEDFIIVATTLAASPLNEISRASSFLPSPGEALAVEMFRHKPFAPFGPLAAQDLMVIAYLTVLVLNSIAYRLTSMRPVRIFRVGVSRFAKDVLGATRTALHLLANVARVLPLWGMHAETADGR